MRAYFQRDWGLPYSFRVVVPEDLLLDNLINFTLASPKITAIQLSGSVYFLKMKIALKISLIA